MIRTIFTESALGQLGSSSRNVRISVSILGGGDERSVTELGFTHVTTKSWAYLGMSTALYWFKSYSNFAEWVDFAYWWKGLSIYLSIFSDISIATSYHDG